MVIIRAIILRVLPLLLRSVADCLDDYLGGDAYEG